MTSAADEISNRDFMGHGLRKTIENPNSIPLNLSIPVNSVNMQYYRPVKALSFFNVKFVLLHFFYDKNLPKYGFFYLFCFNENSPPPR